MKAEAVYFYNGCIEKGTIVDVRCNETETTFVKVRCSSGGVCWQDVKDVYASRKYCEKAVEEKSEAIRHVYRKQINSVQDLVKFMFNHNISESMYSSCDKDALQVALEKACDLLGLTYEDIYR